MHVIREDHDKKERDLASLRLGKSRKGTKDWGAKRVGLQMKTKLGYTCDTHT